MDDVGARPAAEEERRLRRVIVAAAVTQGAINLDFFAMGVALPRMAQDLGTTATALQWVVSGYLVAVGAFFVAGGRLGDILGRKRLLLVGVVIFALSSAIAGASPDPELVIALRVVQGVGAAIAFPVSLAIVTNAFPAGRVERAIGIVFGIAVIGTAAGPVVGGLLTEVLSWRFVFWLNIPIAVVVVGLVLTSVDESRDETVPRLIDLPGLVLIVGGVASISFTFDKADRWGWLSASTIGLLAVGLVLLLVFVLVESRVRYPLLDLSLFKIRVFSSMIAAGSVGNAVNNIVIFASTLYLQQGRDLSPVTAGAVFLAFSLGAAIAGQVSGRVERFPSWQVMCAALTVGGAASIGLSWSTGWAAYVPFFALAGFGFGLAWAYASVATQAAVPPDKAGAASGVVLTVLVGLGGIAVAVAASVIETRAGVSLAHATQELIRIGGALALAGAIAVALTSQGSRTSGALPRT
jgi:EmrB/QacA subfamily drug resistance transporter